MNFPLVQAASIPITTVLGFTTGTAPTLTRSNAPTVPQSGAAQGVQVASDQTSTSTPALSEAWLGSNTLSEAATSTEPLDGQQVTRRTLAQARGKNGEAWAGKTDPRNVHVTQIPSRFNRTPTAGNKDCGPASVVMALKLVGLKLPGVTGSASAQGQINRARQLAGAGPSTQSTTNHELARVLERSGAVSHEVTSKDEVHNAVLAGQPVILNGNARNAGAYGPSFKPSQLVPFDGAHWIVVSGFDTKSGTYLINDPLSKVGVLKVTPAQLEAYMGGSLGIVVGNR